jgi:hypothetical protein
MAGNYMSRACTPWSLWMTIHFNKKRVNQSFLSHDLVVQSAGCRPGAFPEMPRMILQMPVIRVKFRVGEQLWWVRSSHGECAAS